jgi:hypothetical protein
VDYASGAAALLQIAGSLTEGQAKEYAAYYSAALLERNAQLARLAGADAIVRGAVDESLQRRATTATIGKQRTAYAASGVQVDSGSAQDVIASTRGEGEFQAQTIKNNAARAAWGYEEEAQGMEGQARLARAGGKAAMDAAWITGATRAAAMFR